MCSQRSRATCRGISGYFCRFCCFLRNLEVSIRPVENPVVMILYVMCFIYLHHYMFSNNCWNRKTSCNYFKMSSSQKMTCRFSCRSVLFKQNVANLAYSLLDIVPFVGSVSWRFWEVCWRLDAPWCWSRVSSACRPESADITVSPRWMSGVEDGWTYRRCLDTTPVHLLQ